MAIEILSKNLPEVIDKLERLLELLVFHKLDHRKIEQIKAHMTMLRLDPKPKDIQFDLQADERGNTTFVCKIAVKELVQ